MISNDSTIEADWKSFNSLIKVPAEFKVNERTQCSRDLLKELTAVSLKAKSGGIVTGGTKLHDQSDTSLCAYFSTMSALRHQLRKAVGNEKSGIDTSKIDPNNSRDRDKQETEAKKYVGLDVDEYLKRRDKDEKRFERDLAVMIGCVSPRPLSARFRIRQSFDTYKAFTFKSISYSDIFKIIINLLLFINIMNL